MPQPHLQVQGTPTQPVARTGSSTQAVCGMFVHRMRAVKNIYTQYFDSAVLSACAVLHFGSVMLHAASAAAKRCAAARCSCP